MSSFEDFLNSSEEPSESENIEELHISLTTNVSKALASIGFCVAVQPVFPVFFSKNREKEKAKFSEEVANYVTSNEFISVFSNNLGEPKATETEKDFVERASCLLKSILDKKFKI